MKATDEILKEFDTISLGELENIKLSGRKETKFVFLIDSLPTLLSGLSADYNVLAIDGKKMFTYKTYYFDTPDLKMYLAHHNGKSGRYKIRRRTYENTNENFLEVKFKSNQNKVFKKRIKTKSDTGDFNSEELSFLRENVPYSPDSLAITLINTYRRITLVSKDHETKMTMDLDLEFHNQGSSYQLNRHVIAEVKQVGNSKTHLTRAFMEMRLKPVSISKYCLGVNYLYPAIKKNNFKEKLIALNKITNDSLFNVGANLRGKHQFRD